ncbi:hypothetical protein KFK09_014939 [Dendrobium nobile]|uniref:Uncharacterized protein n=1 Tax=Dendrobium nobile TaxID=94219 RepID=A0A8T3B4H7_DENNO|nr:hypothetical protein KFK09_014939 [Dendrobium nobile]
MVIPQIFSLTASMQQVGSEKVVVVNMLNIVFSFRFPVCNQMKVIRASCSSCFGNR